MSQTWLRPNRRYLALLVALNLACWLALLAVALASPPSVPTVVRAGAWVVWVLISWGLIQSVRALLAPRIALDDDHVVFNFAVGESYRVPIDCVECFFLGQGETGAAIADRQGAEASAVVVRLSERADAWRQRSIAPRWGRWCNNYITLRGTWCEPIDPRRVAELNHQLAAAKRARRGRAVPAQAADAGPARRTS